MMEKDYVNEAEIFANKLGNFYFTSVGKNLNYEKEFSMLIEWESIIEQAIKQVKKQRIRWAVKQMLGYRQECAIFMEANKERI